MVFSRGHDFSFCDLCGMLLSLDSLKYAKCPLCGLKRSMKEIEGKETRYTITAEDIRRELSIEPFVKLGTFPMEVELERSIINEVCPKCSNPELTFTTRQLRSVDEGQTIFYECQKCGHKYSLNS